MKDDWRFIALVILVAVGYFCLGRLYEIRKRVQHWQRGFDAAKGIYGKSQEHR